MACSNRSSGLARPDLLLTEYGCHIHYMDIGPPETHVKFRFWSNDGIKSYGLFEPLLLPGSTGSPPHRVVIPHPLYGKRTSGKSLKFSSRSNDRIYSYGPFEQLLLLGATWPPCHRVSIPHPLYVKGHPETPVKFRSRSNGRIKSYCLYEPLLLPGTTRPPPHRVWIPHPLYGKRTTGNSTKILIPIHRSDL